MGKNFWTFVGNDKYDIGLTGQTTYVYDKNGKELAKFKDLTYAYKCAISPNGDIFVIKSTGNKMAIYSFEDMSLIKKFKYSKIDDSQDDNCIFSSDGRYFYNIERHITSINSALSIYDTEDFSLIKCLFKDDRDLEPKIIECDNDDYYILGYFRNHDEHFAEKFFVSRLINDNIEYIKYITEKDYEFYHWAKKLEGNGFTSKAYSWSGFQYFECDLFRDLEELKSMDISLASLWKKLD